MKPNTTYTLSMKVEGSGNRLNYIQEYDENYNTLGLHNYGSSTNDCRTFTTRPNCKYIGFRIGVMGKGEILIYSNIQLEEKQTKTDYVDYQQHKTEILIDEPLRSLPNGVCDEIIGNQIIRRVGIGNLHNKFYIYNNADRFENTVMFLGEKPKNMKANSSVKSNKLPTLIHWNRDEKGIFVDNDINIHIPKDELETLDDAGCLRWLSDNPTEVIYELTEPIIEELPNSITLQGFDDTIMYIENTITPTVQYGYNALIPYKQELSNQKEEVETNTLDIEQNIIPYLMDMEFNLMLMEDNE